MKKILLIFLTLFLFKTSFSQKENNNWSFGEGVGITFNTTTPTLYTHPVNAGHEVYECMTSISDNSGNMLFYTNGLKVYESGGNVMSGGGNLSGADDGGGVSAAQGILIVRHGSNANLYYIFLTDAGNVSLSKGFRYWTVDMSGAGGLGSVSGPTQLTTSTGSTYRTTEMSRAVMHSNTCDMWVVTRSGSTGTNTFYSYKIDGSGVNPIPVETTIGTPFSNVDEGRGSIVFSNAGDKMVMVHHDQSWPSDDAIEFYDFDASTGVLSNHVKAGQTGGSIYGLAYDAVWSPNDSKVYVSHVNNRVICQYDVGVTNWGNGPNILSSRTDLPGTSGSGVSPSGQIEMGPDGVIYRSLKGSNFLGTISGGLDGPVGGLSINMSAYDLSSVGGKSDAALQNMLVNTVLPIDITDPGEFCDTDSPKQLITSHTDGVWSSDCGACLSDSGVFDPSKTSVGDYKVIYSLGGCFAVDTIDIVVKNCITCPDTSLSVSIPGICQEDSINLSDYKGTAQPGGSWSITGSPLGSTATISSNFFNSNNTLSGNYVVTYTLSPVPSGSCPKTVSRNIKVNNPIVTLSLSPNNVCEDTEKLKLSGGSPIGGVYSGVGVFDTDSINPKIVGVGNTVEIKYTYTDTNGCSNSDTNNFKVNKSPTGGLAINDNRCDSGSIDISISGISSPILINWYDSISNGNLLLSNNSLFTTPVISDTKTYYAELINDTSGCVSSTRIPVLATINKTTKTKIDSIGEFCLNSDSIILTQGSPIGGVYIGDGVSGNIFKPYKLGINVINYSYTDTNGCSDTSEINIKVNTLPTVSLNIPKDVFCYIDSTIKLNGGLPLMGNYSGYAVVSLDSFDINSAYIGDNIIKYSYVDTNGCSGSSSDTIKINPLPAVYLGYDKEICKYLEQKLEPILFGVSNSYVWNTGDSTFSINVDTSGTYKITVTDTNGCVNSDEIILKKGDDLNIDLGGNINICGDDSITLVLNDYYKVSWLDSTIISDSIILFETDTIDVLVIDENGCFGTDTITVKLVDDLNLTLRDDTTLCELLNETVSLTILNNDISVLWNDGSDYLEYIVDKSGIYIATISDTNGCQSTDTVNINEYCRPIKLTLPNIFTPNGDGTNDNMVPIETLDEDINYIISNIEYINIQIYNRWGLLIHVTDGYIPNWDGRTMNGKICSDGVYFWIFNYGDISGGDYTTNGYVHLIR